MVQVAGVSRALEGLKASLGRTFFLGLAAFLSTMDVNKMVNFLLGREAGAPAK